MMLARWRNPLFLALAVAGSVILAAAQQPLIRRSAPRFRGGHWEEEVQCRIPVKPDGQLVVRANPGAVNTTPGPENKVECLIHLVAYSQNPQEAKTCLDRYRIKTIRTRDGALIEGHSACGAGSVAASFKIDVPLKFNLDITTEGGNVLVEKLHGRLRADTTGGDIRAGNVLGPVWVKTTAGGVIDLGNIGANVDAHSAGGNVKVGNVNGSATLMTNGGAIRAGIVNGPVIAQTAGGDIVLQAASGPVVVETAGGQIHLGECGNSVRAQTAGGNIQVAGARGVASLVTWGGNITLLKAMGPVTAQTSAGRILAQIAATRRTFGPSRLETQMGDIDVFIPPTLPTTVDALINQTMGRRIISDFPLSVLSTNKSFPFGSERGQILLQGGGAPLDIRTAIGGIQIREMNPASIARLKAYQESFWKNWDEMSRQHDEAWREMENIQRAIEQQRSEIEGQLRELNQQLMERAREQVEHLGDNP